MPLARVPQLKRGVSPATRASAGTDDERERWSRVLVLDECGCRTGADPVASGISLSSTAGAFTGSAGICLEVNRKVLSSRIDRRATHSRTNIVSAFFMLTILAAGGRPLAFLLGIAAIALLIENFVGVTSGGFWAWTHCSA